MTRLSTLNKVLKGDRDNLRLDVADRLFEFFGLRVTRQPERPRHSARRGTHQAVRKPNALAQAQPATFAGPRNLLQRTPRKAVAQLVEQRTSNGNRPLSGACVFRP